MRVTVRGDSGAWPPTMRREPDADAFMIATSQKTICNRATPDQNVVVPGTGVRGAVLELFVDAVDRDADPAIEEPVHPERPHRVAVGQDVLSARIAERRARSSRRSQIRAFRNASTDLDGADTIRRNSDRRGLLKSSLSSPVTSHVALTYHPVVTRSDRSALPSP